MIRPGLVFVYDHLALTLCIDLSLPYAPALEYVSAPLSGGSQVTWFTLFDCHDDDIMLINQHHHLDEDRVWGSLRSAYPGCLQSS